MIINDREFLEQCVDCVITKDLEEVLMRRFNVNTKTEMWLELNQRGYFIKHYQDAEGKYFQIIERMSKKAKKRWRELEEELAFGTKFKNDIF